MSIDLGFGGDISIERVSTETTPDEPTPNEPVSGTLSKASLGSAPHDPSFYGSPFARTVPDRETIPEAGMPARYCERMIQDYHLLDYNERLNTSTYVNVVFEPEEERVAVMGMKINLADQTVYPSSFQLHDEVVNMLGHLWSVPQPADGQVAGAGCVGSTEATLLAGLALKFRWRDWYKKKHGLTDREVRGVYPNLVMSSMYQACWEKFFKYMDVEPILVKPSHKTMKVSGKELAEKCNDRTIAVVGIMGNHYSGHYDPIWDINEAIEKLNAEKGWQIGIHVDAASGGFIAPFQDGLPAWDFRCKNVLSISASGHKFGQSVCGTGWVVWRQREELSEHVAVSVSYLGGKGDSYTLNFSRPASGVYVQFYKLNRLGMTGYRELERNMMTNAKIIRAGIKAMRKDGKPRFVLLDDGDKHCLPVVTAMLNPDLELGYDDIRLQYVIAESHWYVSAYAMSFTNPETENKEPLFRDAPEGQTMFRIVVKSNLTAKLALHLLKTLESACEFLDEHSDNHITIKMKQRMQNQSHAHLHC